MIRLVGYGVAFWAVFQMQGGWLLAIMLAAVAGSIELQGAATRAERAERPPGRTRKPPPR